NSAFKKTTLRFKGQTTQTVTRFFTKSRLVARRATRVHSQN
ncbi:MAG: hypothetical protein RI894_1143, partial [Bacteroidota bacterium]